MRYIVVAYYTKDTGYEEEVKNLIASLEKHNMPMDIVGIPSFGSWQSNTQYKPYFIKQMLIRHYPKDILYLDADARMQQYPALFDHVNFDVGVMYRANTELISATLYFANTPKSFELVERWIKGCFQHPDIWDQQILQYILKERAQDLKLNVCHLPETYCQIFDLMQDVGEPVIEQFQASRRFKKEINELK